MARIEREYAEALYLLADGQKKTGVYLDELRTIKDLLLENPMYLALLSSPAISLAERKAAVDAAFSESFEEHIVSFLKLLCDNDRIDLVLSCIDEYDALAMELSERTVAVITSAVPLDDEQKARVLEKLCRLTKKTIEPQYAVDSSLLGGMKVEVQGVTYDGTIKRRLRDVKDVMSR